MQLLRYDGPSGVRVGVRDGETVIGLPRADAGGIDDLETLAAHQARAAGRLAEMTRVPAERVPLAGVRLLCPLTRPRKILGIGLNYQDHVAESAPVVKAGAQQIWFNKQVTALAGPQDPIEKPDFSDYLDYEGELVVVIGRGGRHIPEARALAHVFGYCVGNDVSVRDWQLATPTLMIGKSFDTHAPIGPWITLADAVPDPQALMLVTRVNGEIRQQASTADMRFGVAQQIAHLSRAFTLEPGDLLFTGTPAGVGGAMKPPQFLQVGDRVQVEISRLGAIDNPVVLSATHPDMEETRDGN